MRDLFIEIWRDDHNGEEPPSHWAICDTCHGDGTSTAYLGAYTQSDREEMGDEWYEFTDNVRSGMYDRECDECHGSGKVREFTGEAEAEWHQWCREAAADAATMRAESGYY